MAEINGKKAIDQAIRELTEALEVGMYYGETKEQYRLKKLLSKLGIKAAHRGYVDLQGSPLSMESLDELLNKVAWRRVKP